MKKFFRKLFGYNYLINLRTMEIHSLKNEQPNCKIHLIAKHNKEYITKKRMKRLLDDSSLYDGCRWCMKDYHTD
jgi:hypothetical protein